MGRVCEIKLFRLWGLEKGEYPRFEYSLSCDPTAQPYEILHDLLDFQDRNSVVIKKLQTTELSLGKVLKGTYNRVRGTKTMNLQALQTWLEEELDKRYEIKHLLDNELRIWKSPEEES